MSEMNPELWRRVKQVASAALDLEPSSRGGYLDGACAGDAGLRREVDSLLHSTDAATPYFEMPIAAPSADALFPAGTRIGPYRVDRELATGGMGSVFLAERDDGQFTQRVAIKVVRGGFANTFLLQRFLEERRILASLQHPNIARLLDGGTTAAGLPYVVMEYVEGMAIDRFCAERRLPLAERLEIFRQVCAAVQYAHRHLIVHRDIKAANIIVAADGAPKLLDFGIAKLLNPAGDAALAPQTMIRVMTPESASPEQLSGRPVTVSSDVYALGVLLYRLLTEESPYQGPLQTDADVGRAVCEEIPVRPSARRRALDRPIPADVDMIVMKALRKEPERRYESAEQLSDDIQRFLERRPVLASPDSISYRSRKFVGRHRAAMAAVGAVVIAVAGGVAATVWQARTAERERSRAEAQFNAVRGLARSVMGELHDAVAKLPGSTPAEEILIRRATEYLDALARQAQDDPDLRRELASGYVQLATIQGTPAFSNLGDREAARRTIDKAIALLDSLAGPGRGESRDRLALVSALLRAAAVTPAGGVDLGPLQRAQAILESIPDADMHSAYAYSVAQGLWQLMAGRQTDAGDYAAARVTHERQRKAAEAALRLTPENPEASRNLSLAYKELGAVMEMTGARAQAIPLYEKSLQLDQQRLARDPKSRTWRLDLSFAEGAMGAALQALGDLKGARAHYERAVAVREQVLAEDPQDDFARLSVARGYAKLATIRGDQGAVAASMDYARRRVRIYADRLAEHPERLNRWKEYADAALEQASRSADLLAAQPPPPALRRTSVAAIQTMLDDLAAANERWVRGKHAGVLVDMAAVQKIRARLR